MPTVAIDPRVALRTAMNLRRAGRLAESAAVAWRMLAVDPLLVPPRLHLGNVLAQQLAAGPPRVTAGPSPVRTEGLVEAAEEALRGERASDALRALDAAAAQHPFDDVLQARIGALLWDLGLPEAALVHYDIAVRLRPDVAEYLDHAATLAASLGLAERAQHYLGTAFRHWPTDGIALRAALAIPAVESSTESIAATRRRIDGALEELLAAAPRLVDPLREAQLPLFYLTYHGENDRPLLERLSSLLVRSAPELAWEAPHVRTHRREERRIRVGFLSRFLRDHSIGKTTRGLVAQLARDRFEVYVINLPPAPEDATGRFLEEHADRWVTVSGNLPEARREIGELGLDVLFYQDIGLEPFSYYLAHARLAPVQCVSFGHPDTTGIANVDYFVSNDLYEPEKAEQHYSERLFLLHDLPTLAYYYRPQRPETVPSRAQLGLPERERLYLCPQTLFKLHPAFDPLLAQILRLDPQGRVLLIRSHCEQWSVRLQERFRRVMPDVAGRISFLPELPGPAYLQLLASSDVVLDTPHFNGMNTSLEAFSVGTPVVTLPTGLQRGRHTQAMYRKMELTECIARAPEEYPQIATRIARESDVRRELQRSILERHHVLYENPAVVREFERFFSTAVEAAAR